MTDLRDLIERLERADGPDRELDALIWRRMENRSGVVFPDEKPGSPKYPNHIPAYTASLDAALALKNRVLPGRAAAIGDMAFEDAHRRPWAVIWSPGGTPGPSTEGATPAIALCLALLRTLETEQ